VRQFELDNTTEQILKLRERMGDTESPPDKIKRGYYPDGSRIRPEVHALRVARLEKLEKRAAYVFKNGLLKWFNARY
jgi:hypothetical protein